MEPFPLTAEAATWGGREEGERQDNTSPSIFHFGVSLRRWDPRIANDLRRTNFVALEKEQYDKYEDTRDSSESREGSRYLDEGTTAHDNAEYFCVSVFEGYGYCPIN